MKIRKWFGAFLIVNAMDLDLGIVYKCEVDSVTFKEYGGGSFAWLYI